MWPWLVRVDSEKCLEKVLVLGIDIYMHTYLLHCLSLAIINLFNTCWELSFLICNKWKWKCKQFSLLCFSYSFLRNKSFLQITLHTITLRKQNQSITTKQNHSKTKMFNNANCWTALWLIQYITLPAMLWIASAASLAEILTKVQAVWLNPDDSKSTNWTGAPEWSKA